MDEEEVMELARVTGSVKVRNMDDLARLGEMFAKSGFFKDTQSAAQCGVKILAGLEHGFGAFASMSGINIIQGKPSLGANLMAAAVKRSGKYDYRVKEMSDTAVSLEFFQNGESLGVSTFTAEEAKKAEVKNMGKFPRNMLFARAMSNGVRWFCPDVFVSAVYTPEELGASVDDEGEVTLVRATEKLEGEMLMAVCEGALLAERAKQEPVTVGGVEVAPIEDDEEAGEIFEGPFLSGDDQQKLHGNLGLLGLLQKEHYQVASDALGREIASFAQVRPSESGEVMKYANVLMSEPGLSEDKAVALEAYLRQYGVSDPVGFVTFMGFEVEALEQLNRKQAKTAMSEAKRIYMAERAA